MSSIASPVALPGAGSGSHAAVDGPEGRASHTRRHSIALCERAAALAVATANQRVRLAETLAATEVARARLDAVRREMLAASWTTTDPPPRRRPAAGPALPPPDPEADRLPGLHRRYASSRDRRVRGELAAAYDGFAVHMARRFTSRREAVEDLVQVARIGLLHAIDRFDPDLGRPFLVYARATIAGELRRHVRDHTWGMRVPRSLQERYLEVVRAVDDLTQSTGRSPSVAAVAATVGCREDDVLEAMEVGRTHRPDSFDAPGEEGLSMDPGADDLGFGRVENRELLSALLRRLPEREQSILEMRFVDEMTQAQIAARLGVSQMYVSRILARILARMQRLAAVG